MRVYNDGLSEAITVWQKNCIVLPVMERVPKGRETREERVFFPVGTDRPARRRPAALDHPVSPVPGIGPAGLESSVPRPVYKLYTAPAASGRKSSSPSAYPHRDFAKPVCFAESESWVGQSILRSFFITNHLFDFLSKLRKIFLSENG